MFSRYRNFFAFAALLLIAAGASPAYTAMWQWSKTPASNGTADPTIDWSEGMSPSAINDSARAMMARLADWRDDISGALATTGTATAYALATNEGNIPSPPNNGTMVAFIPNVTNGLSTTLVADGGTAYPLFTGGTNVPAGTLIAGTPYRAVYNTTQTAWLVEGITGNPYNVPFGSLLSSTISTPPNSNFIIPAGQCISTTTYATYWVSQGSPASGGCPGGQFAVIDLRGRVPAALDNIGGTPAGVMTSSATGCGVSFTAMGVKCGGESQLLTLAQTPTGITSANASQNISVSLPTNQSSATVSSATITSVQVANTGAGSFWVPWIGGNGWGNQNISSGVNAISTTSNNTGGAAHPNVQPTIGLYYFLRVI